MAVFFPSETPSFGDGGIGFLLSPPAMKALPFVFFPSHRIGKIVLDVSDRRFHVICFYAPIAAVHHSADCRIFYDDLFSVVNDTPLRDHILICDDRIAPLTADGCRGKNTHGEPNSIWEALLAFTSIHVLIPVCGTTFQI